MKKMEKYIYIAIIIILVGVISAGATYIIMKNNDKTDIKENENKPNIKEDNNTKEEIEKITLTPKELEEYLSYIPLGDYLNYENLTKGAYDLKSVNINTIDKNLLISLIISKYGSEYNFNKNKEVKVNNDIMCEVGGCYEENATTKNYYPLSYLNPKIKKIYNSEITNLKNAVKVSDSLNFRGMCYYYDTGNFIPCGGGENNRLIVNYIDEYNATKEELIIYEYAVECLSELNTETGEENNYILNMSTNTKTNVNSITNNINDNDQYQEQIKKYLKENKSKFTKYKHTFKKSNDGYYWYSTESIN